MNSFKKLAILGTAIGMGFAAVLVLCLVGYYFYNNQPKPARPWNTSAIKATFESVDTEGERNTLVLSYTLENNSGADIDIAEKEWVHLMTRRKNQESLDGNERIFERIDLPIYIPARQKVSYRLHLASSYPGSARLPAHNKAFAAWVHDKLDDLNGFTLFDQGDLYQIEFPRGW